MTGTDKAFIRVYGDARSPIAEPMTPRASDGKAKEDVVSVPYVSQYFTAATHVGNVSTPPVTRPRAATENARRSRPRPIDQAQNSTVRYSLGAIGGQSVDSVNRVDGPHPLAPHHLPNSPSRVSGSELRSARPVAKNDPYHAGLPMQSRTLRPFRPQWEVDHFAVPEVCSRLQSESALGLAELFRAVLMRAWRGRPVVAVSSFGRGEGNSTVTLCIARLAATFATRVGVIDGNIIHPSLADMLGLSVRSNWVQRPADQPLTEAAIGAGDDRMVVLPLAVPADDEGANQARDRAASTLAAMRECFDLILIDAGPIFQAAHLWFRQGMHKLIDAAVVVRDVRHTSPLQLEDVCLRIRQAGIEDVSVVENFQMPSLAVG